LWCLNWTSSGAPRKWKIISRKACDGSIRILKYGVVI
jgi:hypothetical protein